MPNAGDEASKESPDGSNPASDWKLLLASTCRATCATKATLSPISYDEGYIGNVSTDGNRNEPKSQTRIQSVSRAISLLMDIAESTDGDTAKHLADRSGLSLATTYHLLTTLWAEGILTKDERRVFRLGPRVGAIAEAYQRFGSVPAEYNQALQHVVRRTGEAAYLGVWRNGGVQVLDRVEGGHAVRVVGLDAGFTEDFHARASGKLLLAFASDDLRSSVLEQARLRKVTPHTITRKHDLLTEFAQIRETGFSFDHEEFNLGVTCVSAPLWRGSQVAACITVSAPTLRFKETESTIIEALQEATAIAQGLAPEANQYAEQKRVATLTRDASSRGA